MKLRYLLLGLMLATPALAQNYMPPPPGQLNLIATGTNQATALQLPAALNVVSTVPGGSGVRVPSTPTTITVVNNANNTLLLYPPANDQIIGYAVNQGVSVPGGQQASLTWFGSALSPKPGQWVLSLPPSTSSPAGVPANGSVPFTGRITTQGGLTTGTITNTTPDSPNQNINSIEVYNYTGGTPGYVTPNTNVQCNVNTNVGNYVWCLNASLYSSDPGSGEHVGIASDVFRVSGTAVAPLWSGLFNLTDESGDASSISGQMVGIEEGLSANGADTGNARVFLDMVGSNYNAGTAPTFGYGLRLNPGSGNSINTGFAITGGTINAAGLDMSAATMGAGAFAIKMPAAANVLWGASGTGPMITSSGSNFLIDASAGSAKPLGISFNSETNVISITPPNAANLAIGGSGGGSLNISSSMVINTLATGTGSFLCGASAQAITVEATTCVASDERLKNDKGALTPQMALDRVLALPGGHDFTFKDGYGAPGLQEGFFAQEVQKTRPDLVMKSAPTPLTPDGTLSVNYPALGIEASLAVKALQDEINEQRLLLIGLSVVVVLLVCSKTTTFWRLVVRSIAN